MAQTGARVTGLRSLVRALEGFGADVSDLDDAFGNLAHRGAAVAAGFVPKRTGRLAGTTASGHTKAKAVIAVGDKARPYAGVMNYGWPAHGVAASEFTRKTDEVMEPLAVEEITTSIQRIIRKRGL